MTDFSMINRIIEGMQLEPMPTVIALYSRGREIAAGDYRRMPAKFKIVGPGSITVAHTVLFTDNAQEDWGIIDEWRVYDADGNELLSVFLREREYRMVQKGGAFMLAPDA